MHSWRFGSNLASTSRICTCSLRRRLRSATFGKICSTRPLSGKVSSTASTARLRRINATVLSSAGTARSSRSGSFDGDQDDTGACPAPMGGSPDFPPLHCVSIADFNALRSRRHDEELQLYAFDVLGLDGEDLRGL